MVRKGPAKKLTIYVDETDKHGARPVYEVLMNLFYKRNIAGVSVFRGIAGYGSDRVFHTAKMLELSRDLPIRIEVVDAAEMIDAVLPEVSDIVERGLIEVSDTQVIKCCKGKEGKA
jgi:PII-like signaling protein